MEHDECLSELKELTTTQQRYSHGRFSFPFGEVAYVDPATLEIQYREIFVDGLYDLNTTAEQPLIIDCGGNIGLSVIRYKLRHPDARILTFEADPHICKVLRENIRAMKFDDVEIECCAVSDHNGQERFVVEGGEGGRLAPEGTLTVPTVRLSDSIVEAIELLKLDIEGAEWTILEDLVSSGKLSLVRNLIVEFHGWSANARSLGQILTALQDDGFAFTFPWSFCEPGLAGAAEPTPFPYAKDAKFIMFLHAWRRSSDEQQDASR